MPDLDKENKLCPLDDEPMIMAVSEDSMTYTGICPKCGGEYTRKYRQGNRIAYMKFKLPIRVH